MMRALGIGWTVLAAALLAVPSALPAATERVALVIGNADYADAPLRNPVSDRSALAAKVLSQFLQARGIATN